MDAAGTYDLVIDTLNENGSDNYCGGSIGGYFDVIVNGTTVAEAVSFHGNMEEATVTIPGVALNAGVNTVHFYCVQAYNGSTTDGYNEGGINLIEMQLQPVGGITEACADEDADGECDVCAANLCDHATSKVVGVSNGNKTHTLKAVCTVCGAEVPNMEAATVIDFKADAEKAAAEFEGWADLQVAQYFNPVPYAYEDIDGVRQGNGNNETQMAAADALVEWLDVNADWSFDDTMSSASANYKKYALSKDASTQWGLFMYNLVVNNGGMLLPIS